MDFSKELSDDQLSFFLIGLLSEFDNRYQAKADSFFEEISWKQFFAIICINMMNEAPTLAQLSEMMGCSHQNVKQILNKLEKKDFIKTFSDEKDKRKLRVVLTEKTRKFCEDNDEGSKVIMEKIFDGISPKELKVTIGTIMKMDSNLKEV